MATLIAAALESQWAPAMAFGALWLTTFVLFSWEFSPNVGDTNINHPKEDYEIKEDARDPPEATAGPREGGLDNGS